MPLLSQPSLVVSPRAQRTAAGLASSWEQGPLAAEMQADIAGMPTV